MRHASAKDGGGSSVSRAVPVTPIALRSKWPRWGSCSRQASTTNTRVGKAKTMNGTRQP